MNIFGKKNPNNFDNSDFGYLEKSSLYFDSACQTLRPQCVIDAETDYYRNYNACGGRVKYAWGEKVDQKVEVTRKLLLSYLRKSSRDYVVCFTANTTYGINLVLNQLDLLPFERIITSDIEHNSVFLSTINLAQRSCLERIVLERDVDGGLIYESDQVSKGIVVVNSVSNIDGRQLVNADTLARDIHERGGILCIDAAQAMVSQRDVLAKLDFDCLFGSAHKMYGPSLGFVVIKRSLLKTIQPFFVGGGMVEGVSRDSYTLINDDAQLSSRLEPGLQDWAGIIGFGAALEWLERTNVHDTKKSLSVQLYEGLKAIPGVELVNNKATSVVSWYCKSIDSHKIAHMYSPQGVMVRSGYFCCHYYLQHVMKLPPLVRVSIGLSATADQVEKLLSITRTIVTTFK